MYNTYHLSLDERISLLRRAKDLCYHWSVDELDCYNSVHRQPIQMPFEEVMTKYDGSPVSVIHRNIPPDDYLEIGFRSGGDPEYFLWMFLDPCHFPAIIANL